MNRRHAELNAVSSSRVSRREIVRSLLLCAVLLVGGFLAGVVVERRAGFSGGGMFANLEAVHTVIEDNYYYYPTSAEAQAELDADMESGAIDGALLTLGDSYTRYLDVDESQTAQEGMEGKYGGVGIEVILDGDVSFVSVVVPQSPADDAGILRGDVIEQINGARVQSTDTNEVLRMLRGELTEQEARELVVTGTRRLARRQMSWFGRDPRVHWLDAAASDLAGRALDLVAAADAGRLPAPDPGRRRLGG